MRSAVQQALADCLARLEAGAGIEECLRGHEALAAELRPLLEAARALRAREVTDYRPEAFQRGRVRMQAARILAAERGGRSVWAGLWRPLALTGVAAVVAVLAALGFTTGVFRFGADTTSAQVDGVVSRVDPDAIIITTLDGRTTIRIGDSTLVLDATGNQISGGEIAPGRSVRIEVDEQDGEYSARRIEVEDDDHEAKDAEVEFGGVVAAVNGNAVTVQASFGSATVLIGPTTEVDGTLTPGVTVEVHANAQNDGSYLATKIEVKSTPAGEDSGGDGSDSSGDGSSTPDSGSGDDHRGDSSGSGDDHSGDSSGSSDDEPDSGED
jgi:hypothetical protein